MSVSPSKHVLTRLTVSRMDESSAARIQTWRYTGAMERYNFSDDPFERQWLCHPGHQYYQIRDVTQQLVAFAVIGAHAQPVGGLFREEATDVLVGIRPDLLDTRRGYGVCAAVAAHARGTQTVRPLRASVPHAHGAGLAVWQRAGFFPEYTFLAADQTPFVVLLDRNPSRPH